MHGDATPGPAGSLKTASVQSAAAALFSQAIKFALNFGVGITLARLLTPADFGLFGVAFAIAGFLEFARDGGLVVPVVQQASFSVDERNTLFWYNSAVGVLLALVVLLAAPVAAHLYAEPRLAPVISMLALTFVFGGVSTQQLALLRRQMRFTTLALCELSALSLACVAALVSAWKGPSYWSLVIFQLTREAVQALLVVLAARWMPAWPTTRINRTTILPLLRQGRLMMAFEVLGFLAFKFDNLVVAWFLGPAALGFYDKAYQFLLLPVNQVNAPLSTVVHSSLSRLTREPVRFQGYLTRALHLSTGLGMPLTAFLLANARTVVLQLPGPQWLAAVPVFQALAPAAFLLSISAATGWVFLALGRAARQLPFAIFTTAFTVVAFFVGVHWGIVGVAIAFSVTRVALFVPTLIFTCAGTDVRWTSILAASIHPALASAAALLASLAMDRVFPVTAWTLPRNALVFGIAYGLSLLIHPGGRTLVRENVALLRLLYHSE